MCELPGLEKFLLESSGRKRRNLRETNFIIHPLMRLREKTRNIQTLCKRMVARFSCEKEILAKRNTHI